MKTQWDFGDWFGPRPDRQVFSVSELTVRVKRLLEQGLGQIWVTGEVSNLRRQSSGHVYFTLKDAGAQLACVLFRGEAVAAREALADGLKLIVQGDLTVYEPRGQYQLVLRRLELQGAGALQLAFERLKAKLQAEGLFAAERKRPLPRYPECIGIVTSPTGAALRDILHVLSRRHPGVRVIVAPCRVQGEGAAAEIAEAIRRLNAWATQAEPEERPDLILVTRGGGSLEDLWAFNEETVARALFESALPVVSAVGHEIDFTIGDFVADLRAATPSAAAELVTEAHVASRRFVAEARQRLRQGLGDIIESRRTDLERLRQRLAREHPRRRLNEVYQRLDDLQLSLRRQTRSAWRDCAGRWRVLNARWVALRPRRQLDPRRQLWRDAVRRLSTAARERLRHWQDRWGAASARLELLSPEAVLRRGYSITQDAATGHLIQRADDTRPGQGLITRLHRGRIWSRVEKAEPPDS